MECYFNVVAYVLKGMVRQFKLSFTVCKILSSLRSLGDVVCLLLSYFHIFVDVKKLLTLKFRLFKKVFDAVDIYHIW